MSDQMEMIKTGAAVASAVIALVGFYVVTRQLKINRHSLDNQTRTGIYNLSASVYKLFVDNPELRPYFCEQEPLPSDPHLRSKILATAELMTDFFEHIVHAESAIGKDVYNTWCVYMKSMYADSSAFRSFVNSRHKDFTAKLLSTLGAPSDFAVAKPSPN